jgi:hypothetical protein
MGLLIVIPQRQVSAMKYVPVVSSPELSRQMLHPRVMPIQYWDAVAVCESSLNGTTARWDDGGNWSGGLGIATSTWIGFGGRQFASKAGRATKEEQLIVANRISVLGFQTKEFLTMDDRLNNRPFFRNGVGFKGWGCVANNKYLWPDRWLKNHPEYKHRRHRQS